VLFALLAGCGLPRACGGGVPEHCYETMDDGSIALHYYGGYPRGEHVWQPLTQADPGSFRHLSGPTPNSCQSGDLYGADATQVFYRARVIPGADPTSFRVLGHGYAADDGNAFYRDQVITPIELSSFRVLDRGFATDGHTLFDRATPVEAELDPSTLEILESPYARDAARVYYLRSFTPIPGADPASFTAVREPGSPNTHVYWAYDRGRAYYFETSRLLIVEGIDAVTFAPLNRYYAKDAKRVYHKGYVIDGADPGSFEIDGHRDSPNARDRSRSYRAGKPQAGG
jgi:hypothetical protein